MHQHTSITSLALLPAALLACGCATAAVPDNWPPLPSRLNVVTPYGTLDIKSHGYIYEARLQIDNTEIAPPIEGLLNITYAFDLPHAKAALVSINDGSDRCPISFRWVILRSAGYTVSPAFGSCSTRIKVSIKGRRLYLQTPNYQKPDKMDVYIYDGKTLKQRH
jgi:hypothetical protein